MIEKYEVPLDFNETWYLVLVQRYKELSREPDMPGIGDALPYELAGYITEIDTGIIDADYMNSRFEKYLKLLNDEDGTAQNLCGAIAGRAEIR